MDGNSKGGEDFQRESSKRTSSSSNSITSLPQDAQEETGSTTSHETFSSLQNLDKAIDSSVQANALESKSILSLHRCASDICCSFNRVKSQVSVSLV